ncbi:MAG TPA: sugar phosphate isomerase/epimerase [Candidatus Limnocylindria bacterium]|nr:sugar phosphate isomerase/epimerase [Candidatus Limnocylindria bacterium]
MNIAYTGWTWLVNHKDNHAWEFEQFLREVSDLGYQEVENFAFILDYFDGDAGRVKALLDQYGLRMANLYQHFSDDDEKDFENALKYVGFMREIGARFLNLQGTMWQDEPLVRPLDRDKVLKYARISERVGRLAKDNGITACFHPHAQTAVFTQEEIQLLLDNTDPALVSLCLDTAHTTIAGMDAVEAFRRWGSRVGYVHLKDVDPDLKKYQNPMHAFCELGIGTVDFRGIHKALRDAGYDGTLCVELDRRPVCNYKSAMISRQYLHNALGF